MTIQERLNEITDGFQGVVEELNYLMEELSRLQDDLAMEDDNQYIVVEDE